MSKSILDLPATMKRLRGNQALLRSLADIYFEDVPRILDQIHAAIAAERADRVWVAAYAIKSLAANFGAEEVVQEALELEQSGKEGNLDEARMIVPRLEAALAALDEALEHELESQR
jgi:HPt (histidine-containing phosphotransfer) domain-containing protein